MIQILDKSFDIVDESLNREFEEFPFELDDFQKHAIHKIHKGEHVLVTAATSSGKTSIAEYTIRRAFKNKKKSIFTSPIKTLSNQCFHEFEKKFKKLGMSIGIITGDIKFNPDADCLIMTTEILRNLLYKDNIKQKALNIELNINDIESVIFDEVHYINDDDRGKVWEESILLLPDNIQLIMLSATVQNAESFATWIQSIKSLPINLIPKKDRVIPLKHYIYHYFKRPKFVDAKDINKCNLLSKNSNKLQQIIDSNNNFDFNKYQKMYEMKNMDPSYNTNEIVINSLIKMLEVKNLLPCLFFVFSRKKCMRYANMIEKYLITKEEQSAIKNIIRQNLIKLENSELYINSTELLELERFLLKGVAVHHSGLIPVFKEIIEILYSKGLIKVLFATETFAVGVNMPTKTVIFTDLKKYTNQGIVNLKTHEYLQMSGRAGRRGLDTSGTVILLSNLFTLPNTNEAKNIMTGKTQEIISKFQLNYQFILKAILSDNSNLTSILNSTLMNNELQKERLHLLSGIEKMKNEVEQLPKTVISDKTFDEYYYLMNPDPTFVLTKNQKKSHNKKIKKIENMQNFKQEYQIYLNNYNVKHQYNEMCKNLEYCEKIIQNDLNKILLFLRDMDYIENYDNIETIKVKSKGIICSQIGECNELLLTEMIFNNVFDNLKDDEIVALLSIFVDTKNLNEENEVINTDNLQLPKNLKDALNKTVSLISKLEKDENERGIYLNNKWELNYDMITIFYGWSKGKNLSDLYYDNYVGNFIKDTLKIDNICKNLECIMNMVEKYELSQRISKITGKIIRNIVSIQSLYIHK